MKIYRFFLISALGLLILFSSHSNAFAKDEWVKVRSKNFFLIGNASDKEIRRVATKLEQFREVFTHLLPKMNFNSPVPTTVIVFKNGKAYRPYKPVNAAGETTDWIAGYFMPREEINYITLSTEGERQQTYQIIFHEYVHYLVNNNLGRGKVPPWFNEGFAEYYDQFTIENDQKVTLGGLNESHLYSLQNNNLIPLDQFFNIDYFSLHQQGKHGANIFYAQSWALMHYLMNGADGKRRPQLNVFLTLVLNGKQPREAFQQAFQIDYAAMEKELRAYVKQRSYMVSIYTPEKKLTYTDEMKSEPMTEAEANAHLGDLLYHANRLPEAEAHLTKSLAAEPDSGLGNTAFGLVKMRQKKYEEAKKHIEKAIAADAKNYLVQYQYAYILSREGMNERSFVSSYSDEKTERMKKALFNAMTLNPNFAESYRLLAFINLVRNENLDEGIQAMTKALSLAPGNQYYQMNLGDLYLRKNDFDKALAIIESVAKTADEPQLRAHAESSMTSLRNFKQQIEQAKSRGNFAGITGGGAPRMIIVDGEKPPTEAEIEKLQAEAAYEAMSGALRTLKPGEKRVAGHLSKIQCANGNVIYSFKSGSETMKFQSKDFETLHLMSFVDLPDFQVGCDTITKDVYALLTFVPAENAKTKTLGQVVAIELVPETFKLKE